MHNEQVDERLEKLVNGCQSGIYYANWSSQIGEGVIMGLRSVIKSINHLYKTNYESDTSKIKRKFNKATKNIIYK